MPQIRVITKETVWEYTNGKRNSAFVYIRYKTYKELKKNIKQHLIDNLETTVSVYRHRRGEWGEWFEHWILKRGEPTILSQGWM
jgi:hypothetical protein